MYFRHVKQKFLAQEAKRSFLWTITSDTAEVVRDGEQEELGECLLQVGWDVVKEGVGKAWEGLGWRWSGD